MKKFSIGIIILAFMISCSNGSKENADNINETGKEKQIVSIVKPKNPQGLTVALNSTDFNVKGEGETANDLGNIYNGTLYYKGNIFTGKVTFDTFYSSGYFFVKDGKLEGEYEKNYKKRLGREKIEKKLIFLKLDTKNDSTCRYAMLNLHCNLNQRRSNEFKRRFYPKG